MKKKKILPFMTTWMDFQGVMLGELSQMEKDKYCMVSLICEIYSKKVKFIETE